MGASIGRCLQLLKTWIFFSFQEKLSVMLISYPNLTCSVIQCLPLAVTIMNASIISSIVLFKTYAKICSNGYLNMDHEKIRKMSLIFIFMLSLVELTVFGSYFGTICTKSDTLHTHYLMRLDMSDEDYVVLPPISNINIYAIVVVQMVHWVCKNRQNRKVNIITGTNSRTP